ncbi:MAG: methyltransferase domain-containing protein [Methylovulum sp.]|uniref:class I SAM-dependent methyltransferase n=1 Tax=Methylovulum sp. TaxID=1916980 RepID=UPI00260DDF37|nr:methyltransferase domain-containing protein [Methylovulum sp.]MDD2724367.1 methyltransferase domain-containing protein [Methylovulum sp.]MDD5126152.1 methyltransferase domain-containing protein [Methylovulum sp.]
MKANSETIKKRYDRIAPYFEVFEAIVEGLFFKKWRKKLWERVEGYHILEVGVGTGKNFAYYPGYARITAIDFSPGMLQQAAIQKERKKVVVDLELMDVQSLYFADNSFDTVIATFVFCSVPMPLKGLKELHRVCKPGGQVLLLEHVLSSKPPIAWLMKRLNPLVLRLFGANIDRNTVKNVKACPFVSVRVDEESGDMLKLIEARKW